MVGKKASTAKAPPKALNGQRDLFHFYQKQPRLKDGQRAITTSSKDPDVSNSHSDFESEAVVVKEDMHPDVSISKTIRQQPIAETNGTIPGGAGSVGLPSDSQRLSPGIDSPSGVNELDDEEPAKTSENSAPHTSQAAIAVYNDKRSTPQLLSEAYNLGSSAKPLPRNKAYAEVDAAALPQGVSQEYCTVLGSSRAVGDERSPTVQDRSSNDSYKASSSEKYLTKKTGGRVVIPDVIDLTVSQGEETQRRATASAEQHCIINVDEDERITEDLPSGRRDAPIDLSSLPKERQPAKALHPFFARQATKEHKDKDANISQLITPITSSHMQVPWPNAEDQHNPGPQTSFPSGSSVFGIYRKTPSPVRSPSTSGLRWLNVEDPQPFSSDTYGIGVESRAPTPLELETVVLSLPSAHREHPGISRCLNEPHGHRAPCVVEDGEMWSQKWKPRCAADVLGNEDNALYLKSWLQALALRSRDMSLSGAAGGKHKVTAEEENIRGTKRHTIVRAVVKKRRHKRRRIDSDDGSSAGEWIIDDDEAVESERGSDNESVDWASSRTMARTSPSLLRRGRYPDVIEDAPASAGHDGPHFAEFSTLTNTILLAGPPGSGKSSTIHACAEELGWEVFEVHPGIGKRSGGSISSLIGDVGKNHHVGRRGVSSTNDMKRGSSLPGFGYLDKGEDGDSTHPEGGKGAIRQSVILLDEVDVLFKEDANFWPTVVNIIKFSHRPIFMTCTDISLIPQDDLPLQTCLYFTPCPSPLAVSFLQCVCLAEGHFVPREQVETAYARTYPLMSCDEPEIPSVPYPSQPPPCSDLRQTLNHLQFWCSRDVGTRQAAGDTGEESEILTSAPGSSCLAEILADWSRSPDGIRGNLPEEREQPELDRIEQHADSASYIDGYLERRPADILEAFATDRYGPSGDDELGHTLLDKPTARGGLAFYARDADMAGTALVESRHVFERSGAGARARDGLGCRERGSTRPLDGRSLRRARVATQSLAVTFLDDVMTVSGPLLPRAAVVLEYTPCVRQMILRDDVLAAAAAAGEGAGARARGRATRWRTGEHARYMAVSAEGLAAARNMSLG